MQVLINGELGLKNVLPNIRVIISRYELGDLVRDGKLKASQGIQAVDDDGSRVNYYQEVNLEVK